jgi:hypothetical protein
VRAGFSAGGSAARRRARGNRGPQRAAWRGVRRQGRQGRQMAKVVPSGPECTSSSVPPWPRMISAAMARPRPVPALARAAMERLEQVIERLFRQAGPGVATSIRQPPSRSARRCGSRPVCRWPRWPGARCARGSTARGATARDRRASTRSAGTSQDIGDAGRPPSFALSEVRRSFSTTSSAISARRTRSSLGDGSSARPKARVDSVRFTARVREARILGVARCTAGSADPPAGRPSASSPTGCCAGRG